MQRWERRLWSWMRRNILWLCAAAIIVVGALIRYAYFPAETHDLNYYYTLWIQSFERDGLAAAFDKTIEYDYSMTFACVFLLYAKVFGSANVPLLVKLTGCALEIVTDGLCLWMLASLLPKERKRTGLVTGLALLWLNPIMIWNVAAWGQTDVYYLLLSVLAVLLLIRDKPVWGLVCLSVGLALKLQTVFLAPLFVMAWFCGRKRFSCLWFLMLPAAVILSGVPAVLVGESPLSTLKAYLFQGGGFTGLAVNRPNLYTLIGGVGDQVDEATLEMLFRTCLGLSLGVFGGLLVWMVARKAVLTGRSTLLLAAWCVLCCNFLLPRMHERYAIVGEALLCCWAVCLNKPRGYAYFLALLPPTLSVYAHILYQNTFFNIQLGGAVYLVIFCALTWETVRELRPPRREAVRELRPPRREAVNA